MPVDVVQVFVSSTWLDLQPERQAVEAALQPLHETKFVGMEYFGSRDETTRLTSLDEVDRSRVYVGIIAGRYGSGITEDEYRRARELNLPCFVYFKRDSDVQPEWRDSDPEKAEKLLAFRQELQRNHIVSEFTSPDELATRVTADPRVTADLHNWLVNEYLTPRLADAAQGRMGRGQARELLTAIKDKSGLDENLVAAARKVAILPLFVSLAVAAVALITATALGAYTYFSRNGRVYRVRATVVNELGVPVDEDKHEVKVWSSAGGEPKKVAGGRQFDIPTATRPLNGKVTFYAEQQRKAVLAELAASIGLKSDEIDHAIRAYGGKTADPYEAGEIALYERNYAKATAELIRSYEMREKAFDKAQAEMAAVALSLGQSLYGQGNYREAFVKFQKANALKPDDTVILSWLGSSLHGAGQYVEAEPLYKRALEIHEKALGKDHPDTATGLNNLALLYSSQGKYAEAEPLYKRTLAIFEAALGPEHPNVATVLENYSVLLRKMNREEEATKLEARANEIRAEAK